MPSKEIQRTVFGVLVLAATEDPGLGQVVMTPSWSLPISTTVESIVGSAIGMYVFLRQQNQDGPRGEAGTAPRRPEPSSQRPDDYVAFDEEGNELLPQSTIGYLPKPGVVVIVPRAVADANPDYSGAVVALGAVRSIRDSEPYKRYFASRHPDFEPLVGFEFDVFVSYSTVDEPQARALESRLASQGLRVFLSSKSIDAGAQWNDALRKAFHSTRLVVVLITPSSVKSPWVFSEVGAFWALGKPVVPAVAGVDAGQLPGLFAQYQARPAGSPDEIAALVREVAQLCSEQ